MIAPLLACASTTRTITRESATGYIHADKPTFTTVMDVQTEVAVRRPQPRREAIDSELSIRSLRTEDTRTENRPWARTCLPVGIEHIRRLPTRTLNTIHSRALRYLRSNQGSDSLVDRCTQCQATMHAIRYRGSKTTRTFVKQPTGSRRTRHAADTGIRVREENSQCNYQAVDAQRFPERKTHEWKCPWIVQLD